MLSQVFRILWRPWRQWLMTDTWQEISSIFRHSCLSQSHTGRSQYCLPCFIFSTPNKTDVSMFEDSLKTYFMFSGNVRFHSPVLSTSPWADLGWDCRYHFFPSSEMWLSPPKTKSSLISQAPAFHLVVFISVALPQQSVWYTVYLWGWFSKFSIASLCRLQETYWSFLGLSLLFCNKSDNSAHLTGSWGRFSERICASRD